MKRSKAVFLLVPLSLGACDAGIKEPPYISMTECRYYSGDACSSAPNPSGHGNFVFIPNNLAAANAATVSRVAMGNRMIVARAYRGGFGAAARAMGVSAAA